MLQLRRKAEPHADLLKGTYQNELRAVGRYCDDHNFRHIGVYEVGEGFILRGFTDPNDPTSVTAFEVPEADIQDLIMKNFTARRQAAVTSRSPLCPTGYEDFFRALGYELEKNQAKSVAVQESVDVLAISYLQLQESSSEGYVSEPKSMILDKAAITEMLDEAFRRRRAGE